MGSNRQPFVSKIDILTTTPIVQYIYIQIDAHNIQTALLFHFEQRHVILYYCKNLRFHLTDDMRIEAHVQDICRKVHIDIRRISSIRHLLSIDATKTLLSAFVLPK